MVSANVFTTSMVPGDTVFRIPITPMFGFEPFPGEMSFMPAGYIALPFEWWRADMEYKIVIPVSSFHRGAVQVIYSPNNESFTGDVTNVSLNVIYDVVAGEDHEFRVNYCSPRPFLHTQLVSDSIPIKPYVSASMGFLTMRVVNALVAQTEGANTIVYVFARAKNLQVGVPRDTIVFAEAGSLVSAPFREGVILQGALGDETKMNREHELVPGGGPIDASSQYFGEQILSVRGLMQKPSQEDGIDASDEQFTVTALGTYPGCTQLATFGGPTMWTWSGHFAAMFTGVAASERIKVFPGVDCWAGAWRTQNPYVFTESETVGTTAPMTFCGQNKGFEFTIPYYSAQRFVRTWSPPDLTSEGPKTRVLITHPPSVEGPLDVVAYTSLGPDIRLTCFRQVPRVKFVAGAVSNVWWQDV